MKKFIVAPLALMLLLAVTVLPASTAFAASSEQVVFSGTGLGTFNNTPTPFGFWIWCEGSSSNPYQGQCSGSMYFYALGITKHVVDGSITELAEGQYSITVVSARDNTIDCTLVNGPPIPPVRGPANTVTATCNPPAGTGTSVNAVVTVTGP
jgi:hypothetical protein